LPLKGCTIKAYTWRFGLLSKEEYLSFLALRQKIVSSAIFKDVISV
jgi:hypothetical protein